MLRQFAGLWLAVFGGMATWQILDQGRTTSGTVLAVLAVAVGPLGLLRPRLIQPIYVAWMVLAFPIGWVVSHLILALIFYGLFAPISWLFRLIGRDALHRRRAPEQASYFVPKPAPASLSSYFHQY